MKDLSITYRYNLLPFIQIVHEGLWINTLYCRIMSKEFLQGALSQSGFDHVSDTIVDQIIAFSYNAQEPNDLMVRFHIPPKSSQNSLKSL
jgi:hypothetical protein